MRGFGMALAALALRASPPRPPESERRLAPFIDDADAAILDRAALPQQRAALIASLWPPGRQCLVRPIYALLSAPAAFARIHCVNWPSAAGARAVMARLAAAFPSGAEKAKVARAA